MARRRDCRQCCNFDKRSVLGLLADSESSLLGNGCLDGIKPLTAPDACRIRCSEVRALPLGQWNITQLSIKNKLKML